MSLHREGSDPVRADGIGDVQQERRRSRAGRMAAGTLACPRCDAPVSPGGGALAPADPLACPYCGHGAAVRDFLSLASPTRPARVDVRVIDRTRR